MKNIWFISKYASPPQYSYAPSRLFNLAYEFNKLGSNVTLITSDSNHLANFPTSNKIYNYDSYKGVNITWIKTYKYSKTASLKRLISWIDFELKLFFLKFKKNNKPDIVIVSSLSIFSIVYGYYLKKKFKSFLVFEIRDIWPLTMIEEGGFSKHHPLVKLIDIIERFGYLNADLIVGTMPRLDCHIKKVIGLERPFFCSPLGFNPSDYDDEPLNINNPFKYLLNTDKIIIGYAGSMGITNGLEPFIDTIKKMSSCPNIQFVLMGSGDLKESYENDLKGYDNVIFLPRICQKKVKYFLSACDILYLSTKDSEVWKYGQSMNKIVEYMLAGKPILATYTGYQSMINEAECGMFINSTDPEVIMNALQNYSNKTKDELRKIGENGKIWIHKNRTYSKLAKDYYITIESYIVTTS